MFSTVTATRFIRQMSSGRTKPCLLGCVTEGNEEIEVVTKLASNCDRKQDSLIVESIATMLASDLDLQVPEPFLVKIEDEFVQSIADPHIMGVFRQNLGFAFGSRLLTGGYSTWPNNRQFPHAMMQSIAEIFAFDLMVLNPDRRPDNPNLLHKGDDLVIYDYELALIVDGMIGIKPLWEMDEFTDLSQVAQRHIGYASLKGSAVNFDRFIGAFESIDETRLQSYKRALPEEWLINEASVNGVLDYLWNLRNNIRKSLDHILRVIQ